MGQAQIKAAHHLPGGRHAREKWNRSGDCRASQCFCQSRRNDKLRTGSKCRIKPGLIEHTTCSDHGTRYGLHRCYRCECDLGTQCDLKYCQAAIDKRFGDRNGLVDILYYQNRNHRGGPHDVVNIAHDICSLANAAAAPSRPGCEWVMSLTGRDFIRAW